MTAKASGEGVTGDRRVVGAELEWIAESKTYSTVIHENGKIIAMFESPGLIDSKTHQRYADLFLASLDMLSALKGILPYMEAAESRGLIGDEGCHWPVECVRVAINKAEGHRSPDTTSQSDGR